MFLRLLKTAACAALIAVAAPVQAAESWAQVMLLGTHHFGNPGKDEYNITADDVLVPARQAEIEALSQRLQAWEPDMVMVEHPRETQAAFDRMFAEYRAGGQRELRGEALQLGMRTALGRNHGRVHAIDVKYAFMSDQQQALDAGNDMRLKPLFAEMDEHGKAMTADMNAYLAAHSVGAMVHYMNTPDMLRANTDFYNEYIVRMWQKDNQGGAHTLGNWYARNILIFQNMLRAIEERKASRDEGYAPLKVLVIYGQAHIPILRELTAQSPFLTDADPAAWLAEFKDQKRN